MKERLLYPLLASAATVGLHYFLGLRWGWAALAGFVGWPLMWTLITIDDDLPGGWSNPDGTVRPDWLMAPFWGQVCLGLAVTSFIGALDAGWSSRSARVLGGVGVIASALSILLIRSGNLRAVSPNKPLPSPSGPGRAEPTRDDR
jgi:hypothetical protein